MRASLMGLTFFLAKRDATIKYAMDILRLKEPEMAAAIDDEGLRLTVRGGTSDEKMLQFLIGDMRKTTKTQREIKFGEVFDFSFVRKANEEIKASGWKP